MTAPQHRPDDIRHPYADTLRAGLGWLYDTAQPDDAVLHHLGVTAPTVGARQLRFCPTQAVGGSLATVSIDVPSECWQHNDPSDPQRITSVLAPAELLELATALTAAGYRVKSTWNGHPYVTGSVGLDDPPHPTLADAVGRYHAGCPEHPAASVFCTCPGWDAAHGRIVPPAWPATVPA